MPEFIADLRDLKFALLDQVGLEKVSRFSKYDALGLDRDTAEAIIDEAYKLAREKLAPVNPIVDEQGAKHDPATGKVAVPEALRQVYELYCANGWLGLAHNPEYGGQGMPGTLNLAANDLFFGACLNFGLGPLLTVGSAHLIEVFGTEELKKLYLEKMYSGQWAGTMCLTESGAGSDVGASRTKAKKAGDHYLIEGEKIFITFGEHDMTENICHAVLARIEGAPAGTRGLSLFLVPKIRVNADGSLGEPNNVACAGIEEKMGIHATPTCTMVFGGDGECHGWLLGEENKGMRAMFQMMNEARINVGLQGAALANAAFQQALAYARERVQGKDIRAARDPNAPDVAISEHPDVRRMLMWQKAIAEGSRALLLRAAHFGDLARESDDPAEREESLMLLELLTPVCKAYCSDMGFRSVEMSLQTFGGYGYLREYGIEQNLRDGKIASIYEGTNGIQALDLVGRKLPAKGGASMKMLVAMMTHLVEEHGEHAVLSDAFAAFTKARDAFVDAAVYFATKGAENPVTPVLGASPFLELMGDVVLGWLLLEQATIAYPRLEAICEAKKVDVADVGAVAELCANDEEAKFYFGKVKVAQFWASQTLSQAGAKAKRLKIGDLSAMEVVL